MYNNARPGRAGKLGQAAYQPASHAFARLGVGDARTVPVGQCMVVGAIGLTLVVGIVLYLILRRLPRTASACAKPTHRPRLGLTSHEARLVASARLRLDLDGIEEGAHLRDVLRRGIREPPGFNHQPATVDIEDPELLDLAGTRVAVERVGEWRCDPARQ